MPKLNDQQLKQWVKLGQPISISDGDGLSFTLSPAGRASWILRYYFAGKQKEKTIGRYPDISLSEARKLASIDRAKIQQGMDVAAEKQRIKREIAGAWTFERLAEDYLQKNAAALAPSTLSGRKQQLRAYVFPFIGNKVISNIQPHELTEIVERVAEKSLHVARLVLVVIREIYSHGVSRNSVENNIAKNLRAKSILGPRPVSRQRLNLADSEIAAMLRHLPTIGRSNELMVKILLVTAARIGELVKARWEHIDFKRQRWAIPPEHSKNGKKFVIPLPKNVLSWFHELHMLSFGSAYVLPIRQRKNARGDDAHMNTVTLNAALNQLCDCLGDKCRRFTPHDLRSTARSHLSALGVNLVIAERCLNHSFGELIDLYDQDDYIDERRKALEKWASYIESIESTATQMPHQEVLSS